MNAIKKTDKVIEQEIDGEFVLIPIDADLPDSNEAFVLKDVSAFIWKSIDNKKTFQDLLENIISEFDVTEEHAEKDLEQFLTEIRKFGAIL